MKLIFTFCIGLFLSISLFAQDIHLSQYYTSNLSLNPAYTGNFDGDMRATMNSRSQWAQLSPAIKTNMLSIEKKFVRRPNEFGLGFILVNDQLSAMFLTTNKMYLSGSYQKNIHGHFFRFGIQGGLVLMNINLTNQTFPAQWDNSTGDYNLSQPTGVIGGTQNNWKYLDINTGVAWSHLFGKVKISAGYALFHMSHPKEGFSSSSSNIPFRHVFNASAMYYFSSRLSFMPHLLYMNSASATDFIIGANANRKLTQHIGIIAGAGYRGSTVNSDAAIITGGMSYNRFVFGLSYDINVSDLSRNAKNKSAWEISLIYTTPSRSSNKVTLPCDRY